MATLCWIPKHYECTIEIAELSVAAARLHAIEQVAITYFLVAIAVLLAGLTWRFTWSRINHPSDPIGSLAIIGTVLTIVAGLFAVGFTAFNMDAFLGVFAPETYLAAKSIFEGRIR